jgi:hypothetical protein
VESPHLATTALEEGLQVVDNLVDNFFEIASSVDWYLKFKLEVETVTAPCQDLYKDMVKNVEQ